MISLEGKFAVDANVRFSVTSVPKAEFYRSHDGACGGNGASIPSTFKSTQGSFVVTIMLFKGGIPHAEYTGTLISRTLVVTAAHVFRKIDVKATDQIIITIIITRINWYIN